MAWSRFKKVNGFERVGNNFIRGFHLGCLRGPVSTTQKLSTSNTISISNSGLGTVTYDGDYVIQSFSESSPADCHTRFRTYERSNVIAGYAGTQFVEYLVCGGGGGGYGNASTESGQTGGGGGAGGMVSNYPGQPAPVRQAALPFAPVDDGQIGIATITIGSGGGVNSDGGYTSWDSLLIAQVKAEGGGAGYARPGGSGGCAQWPGPRAGGTGNRVVGTSTPGTPNQGNDGGTPARDQYYPSTPNNSASGGGGAGGSGTAGTSGGTSPGNGGDGIANDISGSSVNYCAGGGGGGTRKHAQWYGRPHDPLTPYPGGYGGTGGSSSAGGQGGVSFGPITERDATPGGTYGSGGGGGSVKYSYPGPFSNPGTSRGAGSGHQGVVYLRYKYKGN